MKSISQKRGKTIHTMFTWEKQNPTLVKTNTNCPHMFQRAWCPVTHILLMIIQQKNLNGLDLQRRLFLSFFHTHLSTRMNYFKYPSIYVPGTTLEGGGAEGALAPSEFDGSERRTEGERDNPLLKAPSESKS